MTYERVVWFAILAVALGVIVVPCVIPLVPRWRKAVLAVTVTALVLRAALTAVNLYANDDHVSVVEVIAYENRTPEKDELPEAFQPPLYHHTAAAVLHCLPGGRSRWKSIRVAQALSCVAGGITLALCAWFLSRTRASDGAKLVAYSWVALDPQMIGIHSQATNDGFVIACGTAAFVAASRWFETRSVWWFAGSVVASGAACLSKGNGLVVPLAIVTTAGLSALGGGDPPRWSRAALLRAGGVFTAGVLVIAVAFGPYVDHARRYGSPFVINAERPPPPRLFEFTVVDRPDVRPGVRSIADAVLTFRLAGLLAEPALTAEFAPKVYPEHRTSLWTQVYAGAHSANAQGSPKKWARVDAANAWTLRSIYVLALVPSAILLGWLVRRQVATLRALLQRGPPLRPPQDLVHDVAAVGFLAFLVAYAVPYRDIGFFKAVFAFPAVVAYCAVFVEGWDALDAAAGARPALRTATRVAVSALFMLFAGQVVLTVGQLL